MCGVNEFDSTQVLWTVGVLGTVWSIVVTVIALEWINRN